MKISSFVSIVPAIVISTILILPGISAAVTMSPLVNKFGGAVCQGKNQAEINGCKLYLHYRITESRDKTASRDRCFRQCGKHYNETTKPGINTACRNGCTFVFDLDQ